MQLRVRDALGDVTEVAFSIRVFFAPDLVISRLTMPSEGDTGAPFNVSYRETNSGTQPATGPWTTQLWLSSDETLDAADTLLGEYPFNGTLQPGQFIERSLQFRLPDHSGRFHVIAVTDAGGRVIEAEEGNNVRVSDTVTVAPAYSATVQTDTRPRRRVRPSP